MDHYKESVDSFITRKREHVVCMVDSNDIGKLFMDILDGFDKAEFIVYG
ncbi:MAG: hypothetical protein ACTSUE_24890 [Promethearchaeota archaeon]